MVPHSLGALYSHLLRLEMLGGRVLFFIEMTQ